MKSPENVTTGYCDTSSIPQQCHNIRETLQLYFICFCPFSLTSMVMCKIYSPRIRFSHQCTHIKKTSGMGERVWLPCGDKTFGRNERFTTTCLSPLSSLSLSLSPSPYLSLSLSSLAFTLSRTPANSMQCNILSHFTVGGLGLSRTSDNWVKTKSAKGVFVACDTSAGTGARA